MIKIPDDFPHGAPNPPKWKVLYINDRNESMSESGVVPEARTDGLAPLGLPELMIRLASPSLASLILDRLGTYMTMEGGRLQPGDMVALFGVECKLVKEGKFLRLTWERDQPVDL